VRPGSDATWPTALVVEPHALNVAHRDATACGATRSAAWSKRWSRHDSRRTATSGSHRSLDSDATCRHQILSWPRILAVLTAVKKTTAARRLSRKPPSPCCRGSGAPGTGGGRCRHGRHGLPGGALRPLPRQGRVGEGHTHPARRHLVGGPSPPVGRGMRIDQALAYTFSTNSARSSSLR
jgi:hypothetical protein